MVVLLMEVFSTFRLILFFNMLAFKSIALKVRPTLFVSQKFFSTTYENIIVEKKDGNVAQITLNRPKALNALCLGLFEDLSKALKELD